MNRFKPYFCFVFKGGHTEEDDIPYYELNYCGEGCESFDCFYIYDDHIYRVSSCREIADLILEDNDVFMPLRQISLQEYCNWRDAIYNCQRRIIELINNSRQVANNGPRIGDVRCWRFEDNSEICSYDIYAIEELGEDYCKVKDFVGFWQDTISIEIYESTKVKSTIVRDSYTIDERIYTEINCLVKELISQLSIEIQQVVDSREAIYPCLKMVKKNNTIKLKPTPFRA